MPIGKNIDGSITYKLTNIALIVLNWKNYRK